ncbi:flagellar motor switch protein FliG [Limnohabitans sp. Jir61]|jgi:flagellar motor switch protein FliG|uniref:flagellar motor switch protein FliG n=1 Tax=Limnohabitans sp. Jir61 TaxID=1826168 RepID=UPI000DD1AAD3|nr:flagellar motor switch protein FliG [Limnohabitans sp. Jir61]PUE30988.1 flagellar motor switch protein FliG [Limnohabitans sp. Jir61]
MAEDTIVMTDKLRAELANITSTQRAAVLMLLLGEEQAAEIIKYLNPKEVQALGAAMVQVANFSQEAVNFVLDEFVEHLKKQNNVSIGGADYVEKVMRLALGDDKAASVLGRIMPGQGTKGLDILSWMDARGIADMIRGEHPQVVAIILSLLESEVAADVLTYLPPDVRPEVIQRVASLDTVQPSAMAELEAIMKQQFSKNASAQSSSFGGIKAAAKIMNLTKTALEASIMNGLNDIDPDLMLKIQDNMFTFENLVSVDNKGIQVLMRAVEPDMLMMALKSCSEETANRFFDNMSERARGMFKDDMEAKGPQRMADVEDAQKQIMRKARKLSDSGELILGGADFV